MVRKTFASSVVKIDAKGNRVISDYVDEDAGERLEADVRADESSTNEESEAYAAPNGEETAPPAGFENEAEMLAAQGEPSGDVNADTTDNTQVPATTERPEDDSTEDDSTEDDSTEDDSTEDDNSEQASDARPKDSDNKDAWFAYAQSKGFDGAKEDQTKEQLIATYGG